MKYLLQLLFFVSLSFVANVPSHAVDLQNSASSSLQDLMAGQQDPEFLPVDEAFIFDFQQQGQTLKLTWIIADGYYLYKDKTKFATTDVTLGDIDYPASTTIEDEYFGTSNIYRQQVTLTVPISNIGANALLKVKYQGCADAGLCYPPTKKEVPLISVANQQTNQSTTLAPASNLKNNTNTDQIIISSQDQLAEDLAGGGLFWTLLAFFGLGLGLAFTPCVFPMYPILTGIIAGRGNNLSARGGFLLSFSYVQGMAITYAGLGLVVASAGVQFQAYFQHPAVLISLSLLFVLLALSMFGWYELQLPSAWQNKVSNISNKQKSGSLGGVFVMGMLSGLIASPCTTAPLSGALLFVAKGGDLMIGALTLYILSLGMGLPLLVLGASGGKLLPKAGAWMDSVKTVFGFLLLAVPLILLDRIIDIRYTLTAGAILTLSLCAYLYHIHHNIKSAKAKTSIWLVTMLLFFMAVMSLYQTWLAPTTSMTTNPQMSQIGQQTGQQTGQPTGQHNVFINVATVDDLNAQLVIAKSQGRPVLIDLYADWCVACKEFEKFTFTDPAVIQSMSQFMLIRANVTENNYNDITLLKSYGILGLPTLLFFNRDSVELTQQRVTGFMGAEQFNQHLTRILQQ